MQPWTLVASLALVSGCTGVIDGGSGGSDSPDGEPVAIVSPATDSVFSREVVGEFGFRVALVPIELTTDSEVAEISFSVGDEQAGVTLPAESFTVELKSDGFTRVTVYGYSASGELLGETSVEVGVTSPQMANCTDWLDLFGANYEKGPAKQGVSDPVTLTMPINGLSHRYIENDNPRERFYMDCQLALALHEGAGILRKRGVVEVADIGVYNYRCIGGGEPPDCPNGISQHAYARAFDIAGFTRDNGQFYSVNDDWVIDPDGQATCGASTEGEKDAFLHEVICAQKAAGVWNTVLTPNYNSGHRNHFHVDLGSDFIELRTEINDVDEGPDTH